MYEEIIKDMEERISAQTDSRMASPDEVRICWLISEVERLRKENDELLDISNQLSNNNNSLIETLDKVKTQNDTLLTLTNRAIDASGDLINSIKER